MKAGELNEDARKVIAAGRAGHEPSELVRARVRRTVTTNLARGIVAGSMIHASSLLAATGKFTVALALAGGAGAGVWYALAEPEPELPPQVAIAANLPGAAKPAQQAPRAAHRQLDPGLVETPTPNRGSTKDAKEPTVIQRRATTKPPVTRRETEISKNRTSDLNREVALLADASAKLNQGDAAGANQVLRQYDREVPDKLLVQERAATGVLVQCGLGNVQAARRAAQRFHDAWPRSPLASRIAGSCAGDAQER